MTFFLSLITTDLLSSSAFMWGAFSVLILILLALDLFVFHKAAHEVKFKEAVGWSIFWVSLGLLFSLVVFYKYQAQFETGHGGPVAAHTQPAGAGGAAVSDLVPTSAGDAAVKYVAAYLIEKSLSVDNLFIFLVIFSFFKIPPKYQHRVLFWGIFGALVLRTVFIFAGVALLAKFHWLIYILGAFLVFTGLKMAFSQGNKEDEDFSQKWVVRVCKKFVPFSDKLDGEHFFIKQAGKWIATPLFLALVVVEATDVVFAVDSIPAVLAITSDPFIVLTSNIFAILGLRALYFALAGFMNLFVYLGHGLALILIFIGSKMVLVDFIKVPTPLSLSVVGAILVISVGASLMFGPKKEASEETKAE